MSATQPSSTDLVAFINEPARRAEIVRALPEGVNADRFERMTQTAIIRNPELLKADRASLWLALLAAAQTGLVPDGKQGAIILYGQKATFLPMIGGVRDILAEHGWQLQTSVIYANDEFAADLGTQRIHHIPVRPGQDRGEIEGAYAQATHTRTGARMVEMMSVADINHVRDKSSRAAQNGPWKDWWPRMAEKTVGHRLAKKLALDPKDKARIDLIAAEELDGAAATQLLYRPDTGEVIEHTPREVEATPSTGEADQVAAIEAASFVSTLGKYGPDREEGPLSVGQIFFWTTGGRTWRRCWTGCRRVTSGLRSKRSPGSRCLPSTPRRSRRGASCDRVRVAHVPGRLRRPRMHVRGVSVLVLGAERTGVSAQVGGTVRTVW